MRWLRRFGWYARWVRRRQMARGVKSAAVENVRVYPGPEGTAEVTFDLCWYWWATAEDLTAARARHWRRMRAAARRKGKVIRMRGPMLGVSMDYEPPDPGPR